MAKIKGKRGKEIKTEENVWMDLLDFTARIIPMESLIEIKKEEIQNIASLHIY